MKGTIHRTTKLLSRLAGSLMLGMLVLGCHPNVSSKDTTPPAEVTELKTVTGDGKVSLSWKNPGDTDLYQVEITASPAAGTLAHPVYLSAEKGKAMSFTAEGLSNDTAYTFTVKTLDKALNSSTGVTTEAVKPMDTSDKTPPAEVTDLKADVKGSAVLLSWKTPADDDLYQVEMTASPAAGSLATPIYLKAQKGATGSFSVEGLANGTEYTFTVSTIDTTLHKSTGATVKKTIQQGENTPVAYSDLDGYLSNTASSTGINYITVTGLTPDLVTGKDWYEGYRVPSPLGKILKAHSDKRVALTLPSVSALGDNAFVDCISLTSVTMSEGIASIGNGAFKSCTGLTSISIPNTVIGIGTEAFAACTALTGITLPEGLERINERAFTDCTSLKSISIPDTVRYMSNEVFKNCIALETVQLSTEINGIGYEMFYNCVSLNTITIPNKVNYIGTRAFQGCTSLTSLTVDSSNTKYGSADNMIYTKDTNSLVCVAPGLEGSVIVPANVQAIGDEAFSGCTKLESVTIPNGITEIERNAFRGCTGLTTISLPASISQLVNNPFSGCTSLTTLIVDSSNTKYGSADNMIYRKNTNSLVCVAPGLEGSVTVPANIQTIDDGAFSGCTKLESVTMQDGVQFIRYAAFAHCQNLTHITIPKTVTYIGKWGFGESPNAEIVLAEGISTDINIEESAFGENGKEETLCKKVKIKGGTDYDDIKKKVTDSGYPEDRIEKY